MVVGLVVGTCLLGCGGPPDIAPVSGVVTVEGTAVEGVQILFMPKGKRPASAQTDADGRYHLSTFKENDGAMLGEHAVTIMYQRPIYVSAMGPLPGKPQELAPPPKPVSKDWKSPIPNKYSNPASPLLSATVQEGDNVLDFDLEW